MKAAFIEEMSTTARESDSQQQQRQKSEGVNYDKMEEQNV